MLSKMKMIILNKDKYTNTANILKKMLAINENLNYVCSVLRIILFKLVEHHYKISINTF